MGTEADGEGFASVEKDLTDGGGRHFQICSDLSGVPVFEIAGFDDFARALGEVLHALNECGLDLSAIAKGGVVGKAVFGFDEQGGEVLVEQALAPGVFGELVHDEVAGDGAEPEDGVGGIIEIFTAFVGEEVGVLGDVIDPRGSYSEGSDVEAESGVGVPNDLRENFVAGHQLKILWEAEVFLKFRRMVDLEQVG